MRLSEERKISIYLYIVLLVNQSGVQLPFLNFMTGNNQIILAGLLLVIGLFLFYKRRRMPAHSLGMKFFWWLLVAIVVSIFMADWLWGQDFRTSILLYRHNIWLLYLPLLFYIKPNVKSISNALFAFTITVGLVWIGQAIGLITVNFRESIWGEVLDGRNEFGGYNMPGIRIACFSLYLFLGEMATEYSATKLLKVIIASVVVVLSAQRAMMLFALPLTAYVFLFKMKISTPKKIAVAIIFSVFAITFFTRTGDVWNSFISETTEQLGDKDYNRWMAVDYFLNNYSKNTLSLLLGNGFLSLKNAGGRLVHELGYLGIYIDDIGMLGVWVRYGLIPIVVLYYIVVKVLLSKSMPLYMKLMCIHIGFLPTSWTLVGFHYFVFIFLIYFYCLNCSIISTNNA